MLTWKIVERSKALVLYIKKKQNNIFHKEFKTIRSKTKMANLPPRSPSLSISSENQ